MSSENEETKSEEKSEEVSVKKSTGDVLAAVADKIRTSGDIVRDRVVQSMVEKKLSTRVDMVEKALIKLKDADKELKKLGPDNEYYQEGSDKPVRTFSKQRREERKKAEEAKAKLETALEIVLSGKTPKGEDAVEDHWNKLGELLNK
jgi:hypothetical protein